METIGSAICAVLGCAALGAVIYQNVIWCKNLNAQTAKFHAENRFYTTAADLLDADRMEVRK